MIIKCILILLNQLSVTLTCLLTTRSTYSEILRTPSETLIVVNCKQYPIIIPSEVEHSDLSTAYIIVGRSLDDLLLVSKGQVYLTRTNSSLTNFTGHPLSSPTQFTGLLVKLSNDYLVHWPSIDNSSGAAYLELYKISRSDSSLSLEDSLKMSTDEASVIRQWHAFDAYRNDKFVYFLSNRKLQYEKVVIWTRFIARICYTNIGSALKTYIETTTSDSFNAEIELKLGQRLFASSFARSKSGLGVKKLTSFSYESSGIRISYLNELNKKLNTIGENCSRAITTVSPLSSIIRRSFEYCIKGFFAECEISTNQMATGRSDFFILDLTGQFKGQIKSIGSVSVGYPLYISVYYGLTSYGLVICYFLFEALISTKCDKRNLTLLENFMLPPKVNLASGDLWLLSNESSTKPMIIPLIPCKLFLECWSCEMFAIPLGCSWSGKCDQSQRKVTEPNLCFQIETVTPMTDISSETNITITIKGYQLKKHDEVIIMIGGQSNCSVNAIKNNDIHCTLILKETGNVSVQVKIGYKIYSTGVNYILATFNEPLAVIAVPKFSLIKIVTFSSLGLACTVLIVVLFLVTYSMDNGSIITSTLSKVSFTKPISQINWKKLKKMGRDAEHPPDSAAKPEDPDADVTLTSDAVPQESAIGLISALPGSLPSSANTTSASLAKGPSNSTVVPIGTGLIVKTMKVSGKRHDKSSGKLTPLNSTSAATSKMTAKLSKGKEKSP